MKEVNVQTVRERIALLEYSLADCQLSIHREFELACLRKLLVSLEAKPVAYVHPAYLQPGALGFDASIGRLAPAQVPLFTAPPVAAPADDLDAKRTAFITSLVDDNTPQQFQALAGIKPQPPAAPVIPEGLHPDTADLVIRFATALAEKLHRAEQKYGHANGWMAQGWYNECLQQLWEHIEKGDPRDVAAYCAFMWHHGWVTSDYDRGVPQALATSAASGKPEQ